MATINTSGPASYAVTVGTANQLVCPPNPTRNGLSFYNNSSSATITICPATQYTIASGTAPAAAGAGTIASGAVVGPIQGVPVQNGPGSITLSGQGATFNVDTNSGNLGGAWNGISSIAGGALTVLEF
jgi:hypothetical protein